MSFVYSRSVRGEGVCAAPIAQDTDFQASRPGGHSYLFPHLLSRPGAEAQEWHTDGAHLGKEAGPWDSRDMVSVRQP